MEKCEMKFTNNTYFCMENKNDKTNFDKIKYDS